MSETRGFWTKGVPQSKVSKNIIEPEPLYPEDIFRDIPPRVVALERIWYSLKALVIGKAATDARISRKNVRRD